MDIAVSLTIHNFAMCVPQTYSVYDALFSMRDFGGGWFCTNIGLGSPFMIYHHSPCSSQKSSDVFVCFGDIFLIRASFVRYL